MKRNQIARAATSGLVGLSVLAGSVAYAATDPNPTAAAELQQFLTANPDVAAIVANVEAQAAGTVVGAEFDDNAAGNGVVEFDVMMADGSEQHVLYTLADGSMRVGADDGDNDDGNDDDGDNDGDKDNDKDGDHDGAENEADDK